MYLTMKMKLNEQELNAYINEAIRREINEVDESLLGTVGKGIGKAARGVGRAAKKAGRGVGRYGKAIGGNKKSVKSLEAELSKLRGQLDDVVKQQKALWGKEGSGMAGHELVKQERGLRAAIERGEKALAQAKAGKTLARGTTAAAVGGYLLGNQHGKRVGANGADPDAPWNSPEETSEPTAPDNGGFPWDNIPDDQIAWGQNKPVKQQTQPDRTAPAQSQEQPVQPEQPQRQTMEPIQPVTQPANAPTGVTGPKQTIQTRTPLLGNASQAMVNAASTNPTNISQIYQNAKNAMKRDDYGPTAQQDMQALKNVKNGAKKMKQNQALEEGKLKLNESQLNAYLNEAINEELEEIFGLSRSELNQKYGYQWDPDKTWAQNRAARRANKYNMRSMGYKNAQEYEAGEGYAYGTQPQQQEPQAEPQDQETQATAMDPNNPPFTNKNDVARFQTWFNRPTEQGGMGGKLVVDGICGKNTRAAWQQWLNSQGQGQEQPVMNK